MLILITVLVSVWLIVKLASSLLLLRIQRHWQSKHTVITEFKTPHNLTPAELGYIFDRRFGRNELLATVVQLYQKGRLQLEAAGKDIAVVSAPRKKAARRLDDSEAVLVAAINYSHGGQRLWSDMSSLFSRETGVRWQYERAIINQLIEKGYLTDKARSEPFTDRFIKSLLGFALAWLLFFSSVGNRMTGGSAYQHLDFLAVSLLLLPLFAAAWIGFYIYLSVLSHEIRISAGLPRFATHKLKSQWRDVVGFRDYLRVVEWHRLRLDPDIDNMALPYCLACGFRVNVRKALVARSEA